jgi:hypothetical protein
VVKKLATESTVSSNPQKLHRGVEAEAERSGKSGQAEAERSGQAVHRQPIPTGRMI